MIKRQTVILKKLSALTLFIGLFFFCPEFTVELRAQSPLTLSEEETELLIRSAAFASKGTEHLCGRKDSNPAAPYAARVGIIATVLNRLADPRFPNSIPKIIESDRTFSALAPAVPLSEEELNLTRAALDAALNGFDPTDGALCFSTPAFRRNRFLVTCEFDGYRFGVPG